MAQEKPQDMAFRVMLRIANKKGINQKANAADFKDFDEISKNPNIIWENIQSGIKDFGDNMYDTLIKHMKTIMDTKLVSDNQRSKFKNLIKEGRFIKTYKDNNDIKLRDLINFYEELRADRNLVKSKAEAKIIDAQYTERQRQANLMEQARLFAEKYAQEAADKAAAKAAAKLAQEQQAAAKLAQEQQAAAAAAAAAKQAADEAAAAAAEQALLSNEEKEINKLIKEKYDSATAGNRYNIDTLEIFIGPFILEYIQFKLDQPSKENYNRIYETAFIKGRAIHHSNTIIKNQLQIEKVISHLSLITHPDKHSGDEPIEKYKWDQLSRAMQNFKRKEEFSILGGSRRTRRKSKRNTRSKSKRHVRKTRK